jgi:hypothetical protein
LGNLIGITDFGWPRRGLVGEFDGKVKYGRLPHLKPGLPNGAHGGRPGFLCIPW